MAIEIEDSRTEDGGNMRIYTSTVCDRELTILTNGSLDPALFVAMSPQKEFRALGLVRDVGFQTLINWVGGSPWR